MDSTAKTTMADILNKITTGQLLNQEILKICLEEADIPNFSVEAFSNSGTDLCIKLFDEWSNDAKTFIKIGHTNDAFSIMSADSNGILHELIVPSWEDAIKSAIDACKNINEWVECMPISQTCRHHRFLSDPDLLNFLAILPVSVTAPATPISHHTDYIDGEEDARIISYNNVVNYYYLGNGLWVMLSNASFEECIYNENHNWDEYIFDTCDKIVLATFMELTNKYAEETYAYETIKVGDQEIRLTPFFQSRAAFGKRIVPKKLFYKTDESDLLKYLKELKELKMIDSAD